MHALMVLSEQIGIRDPHQGSNDYIPETLPQAKKDSLCIQTYNVN